MTGLLIAGLAGLLAGGMNAVTGGGSFITFPVLIYLGLPSVFANASSTVALFPGALSSSWAYRSDLTGIGPARLPPLLGASAVGGLAGAVLLLATPVRLFDAVIPWLLLLASAMFALGPRLSHGGEGQAWLGRRGLLALQFVLGIYGGYFGGAVGLIMLAAWAVAIGGVPKKLNPAKTLLVGAANAAAVLCFVAVDAVRWPETIAMMIGAVIGGYAGARAGRHIPADLLRRIVIAFTIALTILFFRRAWA